MKTFWFLLILMDDGSGTFPHQHVYNQYFTKAECIAQRDVINDLQRNVRADCYMLKATKEK